MDRPVLLDVKTARERIQREAERLEREIIDYLDRGIPGWAITLVAVERWPGGPRTYSVHVDPACLEYVNLKERIRVAS